MPTKYWLLVYSIFICLQIALLQFPDAYPPARNLDRVDLGPAPPISNSPSVADVLTKNRYTSSEFRAPIPEEVTNRLMAAQGITKIEDRTLPHPDFLDRNMPYGQGLPKAAIILGGGGEGGSAQDLSALPRSASSTHQQTNSNTRFGEDLTETTLFSSSKGGGAKTSPFTERNRLFTMGKYQEKNGDVDLLETRPSLWSDASDLITKIGESASPMLSRAQQELNSKILQPETSNSSPPQGFSSRNSAVNGAPFGEFLPSFVVNKDNNNNPGIGSSSSTPPLDFSNFRQAGVQQTNMYGGGASNFGPSNPPNMGYGAGQNVQLPIQPMSNQYRQDFGIPDRSGQRYSTNFEINPVSSIPIDPNAASAQSPFPSGSNRPVILKPAQPFGASPDGDSRSLGWFDTNIDRFSKGPVDESARHRVVLNPMDPAFTSGITLDSYLKRPTNFGGRGGGGRGGQQQLPQIQSSAPFAQQPYGRGGEALGRQGMVAQGRVHPSPTPIQNVVVSGSEAADRTVASMPGVIRQENPIGAKTTYLTNENIPGENDHRRTDQDLSIGRPPSTTLSPMEQQEKESRRFTTYPDYRAELFPVLENHVKEDPRPATGRRDGPQGRFGGGTNEYREDWGQKAPITGINDQRQPGPIAGPNEYERTSTSPPQLLNQFGMGRVGVENLPYGPYANKGAVNPVNPRRVMLGDDLSTSDVSGRVDFGRRVNGEYTTPTPHLYGGTTTVIGIPLPDLSSLNNGLLGKNGPSNQVIVPLPDLSSLNNGLLGKNGPANRLAGSGFNPSSGRMVIETLPGDAQPQRGQVSEYHGPEEITRSRYRNQDEVVNAQKGGTGGRGENRYVKMDLFTDSIG